jgi:translation initiation factor IF-2
MSVRLIPDCIFNHVEPIIIGVNILTKDIRLGDSLFERIAPNETLRIGTIERITCDKVQLTECIAGQKVCLVITGTGNIDALDLVDKILWITPNEIAEEHVY